jgi:recombination protein RecA
LVYAQALGVNLMELQYSQPQSGEQCLEIADALVKSGLFGLVVIDSVAALVPESELEGDVGDAIVGSQARLMSTSLRKMNLALSSGIQCNLVFTNQMRTNIGQTYGSKKITPGGKALKFYANVRIEVYSTGLLKEGEIPYGKRIVAHIVKNKSAPPFRKAEFDLIFGKGIDYVGELLDMAVGRGLVEANGAWFSMPEPDNRRLGQGRRNAVAFLLDNRDLCYMLYDGIMTQVMLERGYNPDGTPIPGMHKHEPTNTVTQVFQPVPGAACMPPTVAVDPESVPGEAA